MLSLLRLVVGRLELDKPTSNGRPKLSTLEESSLTEVKTTLKVICLSSVSGDFHLLLAVGVNTADNTDSEVKGRRKVESAREVEQLLA